MQLLLSIQSMIFTSSPWSNEPGRYGAGGNSKQSIDYNRSLWPQVTKFMILEQMTRTDVWKGVVRMHFSIFGDAIKKQLAAWARDNASVRSYQSARYGTQYYHHHTFHNAYQQPQTLAGGVDLISKFERQFAALPRWSPS